MSNEPKTTARLLREYTEAVELYTEASETFNRRQNAMLNKKFCVERRIDEYFRGLKQQLNKRGWRLSVVKKWIHFDPSINVHSNVLVRVMAANESGSILGLERHILAKEDAQDMKREFVEMVSKFEQQDEQ